MFLQQVVRLVLLCTAQQLRCHARSHPCPRTSLHTRPPCAAQGSSPSDMIDADAAGAPCMHNSQYPGSAIEFA